jgi:low affinity Fe/Cu permease
MGASDKPTLPQRFNMLADRLTSALGSLPALVASVLLVVVWALTGPVFNFSDTWQLFINTTTTVVTFWMVFVIQNSANRQGKAMQLKLDEIIRVLADARNEFVTLDRATDDVLEQHEEEFMHLAEPGADGAQLDQSTEGGPADADSWNAPQKA